MILVLVEGATDKANAEKVIVLRDLRDVEGNPSYLNQLRQHSRALILTANPKIESWILALLCLHKNPDSLREDPEQYLDHHLQVSMDEDTSRAIKLLESYYNTTEFLWSKLCGNHQA
ncbi:MAG: hypothetical protein DRJ40_00595 [Thermoprotei archaeon]|nr:MAG: hypothetical protein DRJ40_00595 [Thermoprotei archaeon]